MKRKKRIIMYRAKISTLITAFLLLAYNPMLKAQKSSLDKFEGEWIFKTVESNSSFKIGNMFIFNVKGDMPIKNGSFKNTDQIQIQAVIDVSSINTGIDKRDEHLRSEDFFYTEKYPEIKFKSSSIKMNTSDEDFAYQTKGTLQIRGIEKEELVLFNIEKINASEILITGEATINRLDYEVDHQMAGMDDEATVKIEVKASLQE